MVDIDALATLWLRAPREGAGDVLAALAGAGAGTGVLREVEARLAARSSSGLSDARGGTRRPARILSVAGSDSGGGAGIQADLKTILRLGGYGMTALTAVTVQDTRGVAGVWPVPPAVVAEQIRAVVGDIGIDAVKTGLMGDAATVAAAAGALGPGLSVPLVVDPVMRAKGGAQLLDGAGVHALRRDLFPIARLVTPNLPEAQALTGREVATRAQREEAARALRAMGAAAVLLKGGHGTGPHVLDVLADGQSLVWFRGSRLQGPHTHGTGCTLSAAVATGLGQGMSLELSVLRALTFVRAAMLAAPGFGHGHGPLGHGAGDLPDPFL